MNALPFSPLCDLLLGPNWSIPDLAIATGVPSEAIKSMLNDGYLAACHRVPLANALGISGRELERLLQLHQRYVIPSKVSGLFLTAAVYLPVAIRMSNEELAGCGVTRECVLAVHDLLGKLLRRLEPNDTSSELFFAILEASQSVGADLDGEISEGGVAVNPSDESTSAPSTFKNDCNEAKTTSPTQAS